MRLVRVWSDITLCARRFKRRAAQGNAAVADFMPIFWAFGGEMFVDAPVTERGEVRLPASKTGALSI
ncbi:MAG: hypothetical protein ABR568_02665 [Pyrinomonadaceae bacterium]